MNNYIPVFNTQGMANSMRYTEYRDIVSAISELVDNSIEAEANNIAIILDQKNNDGKLEIKDVYILDDGVGMDDNLLQNCLVFGSSSRGNDGIIGRFGVGLGQASLFAAPRVSVYSWQHGKINNPKKVFLDTNKLKDGTQKGIENPEKTEMPFIILDYFSDTNSRNLYGACGTCIHWSDVDKFTYKRISKNIDVLRKGLGERFRYYLTKNVSISIVVYNDGMMECYKVYPIDPLFLMENAQMLGFIESEGSIPQIVNNEEDNYNKGNPLFAPFDFNIKEVKTRNNNFFRRSDGVYVYNAQYHSYDGSKKNISLEIKASVVKDEYYYGQNQLIGSPGTTAIGKAVKDYVGVSFLRSDREIEFDSFKLFEVTNEPKHRWWGLEVHFTPEADDFFKLSNNKQHIEVPNRNHLEESSSLNTYDGIWIDIIEVLSTIIKLMRREIENLKKIHQNKGKSNKKRNISITENPFDITVKPDDDESNIFLENMIGINNEKKSYNLKEFLIKEVAPLDYDNYFIRQETNSDNLLVSDIPSRKIIINKRSDYYEVVENCQGIFELIVLNLFPLIKSINEQMTSEKGILLNNYLVLLNRIIREYKEN